MREAQSRPWGWSSRRSACLSSCAHRVMLSFSCRRVPQTSLPSVWDYHWVVNISVASVQMPPLCMNAAVQAVAGVALDGWEDALPAGVGDGDCEESGYPFSVSATPPLDVAGAMLGNFLSNCTAVPESAGQVMIVAETVFYAENNEDSCNYCEHGVCVAFSPLVRGRSRSASLRCPDRTRGTHHGVAVCVAVV